MERIRIRITDFLTNGSGLDLTNITAVRLDAGPAWGSGKGRIVIDELMLSGYNENIITGIAHKFDPRLKNMQLSIFPNPFNSYFEIIISGQGGDYLIQLFDASGRIIQTVFDGYAEKGNTIRWQTNGSLKLKPGVYFLKWANDSQAGTEKIVFVE